MIHAIPIGTTALLCFQFFKKFTYICLKNIFSMLMLTLQVSVMPGAGPGLVRNSELPLWVVEIQTVE